MTSDEAVEKWPRLVFDFLEAHLRFEQPVASLNPMKGRKKDDNFFVGPQMITRKRAAMITAGDFIDIPTVKITRNYSFDKVMLKRTSKDVQRRRTIGGAPQILPRSILKGRSLNPNALQRKRSVTFLQQTPPSTSNSEAQPLGSTSGLAQQPLAQPPATAQLATTPTSSILVRRIYTPSPNSSSTQNAKQTFMSKMLIQPKED